MIRDPGCEKCPLHIHANHVCMAGRPLGGEQPLIAFVGQAPGREDDEAGKPFVGPGGELLQQAIEQYKLGPAFFTNTVRCFPGTDRRGKNIPPTGGQISACSDYLAEELRTVHPKYIVAVGNHALKALTGKTGVTTWAGQVAGEYNGAKVFAFMHPDYIIAKAAELPRFEAHAKALAGLLRPQEEAKRPEVRELTPGEAKGILLGAGTLKIAFDFETTGFSPFEGHHIRTFAFADAQRGYWVKVEGSDHALAFVKWFLQSDIRKIAQNLVFESLWSLFLTGKIPKNLDDDTMLLAHCIDSEGPKGLDLLASKYLNAPAYDIAPIMREKGWTYETVPLSVLGPYNALDAIYTKQLLKPLKAVLNGNPGMIYNEILVPLAKLCARMEFRGMHLDAEWAGRATDKYRGEMDALAHRLQNTPEVMKLQRRMGKKEVNFRSPLQMVKLFYDIVGITCQERWKTPSGNRSAKAEFLDKVKDPPEVLVDYLAWKERDSVCMKYLEKFPKFCDEDSIVHPGHVPARQVTGRVSVVDPPIQTVPEGIVVDGKSDGLVRAMFNSRFPGGKMISSDYKALEFRLVCSEADDTQFIEAFIGGLDPHALTAKDLFGKNFTPDDRGKAKVTNFSLIYGVTEYSLAPKLGVSQEEAARIIIQFRKKHPKIFVWMERQYERVRREKIAVNRFGRVRHLQDVTGLPEWRVNEIYREAGNFPIQSAGADITNLAIIEVDRKLRLTKAQSKVVLNHHDSITVDTHPDEVQSVKGLLVKVMQEEIPGRLEWLKLPLQVDVKISDRWGGGSWPQTA